VLSVVSALGLPPLVWGLAVLDGWMVATGLVLQMMGKIWLLDRMVWLYEDMTRASAEHLAAPRTPDDGR
jgi:hypothetical protein